VWNQGQKTLFIYRESRHSSEDFGTDIRDLFFIDNEKPVQPVTISNIKPDKLSTNIPT